jgi:hypothetical protein
VALGFKLAAQFAEVINFAVEGDDELAVVAIGAVGMGHRLRTALRQVDDGQAAVAECDSSIIGKPFAVAVWAAGGHGVADGAQLRPVRRGAEAAKA